MKMPQRRKAAACRENVKAWKWDCKSLENEIAQFLIKITNNVCVLHNTNEKRFQLSLVQGLKFQWIPMLFCP